MIDILTLYPMTRDQTVSRHASGHPGELVVELRVFWTIAARLAAGPLTRGQTATRQASGRPGEHTVGVLASSSVGAIAIAGRSDAVRDLAPPR